MYVFSSVVSSSLSNPLCAPYGSLLQGTVALELMQQAPELDIIVVPISGGGLISGAHRRRPGWARRMCGFTAVGTPQTPLRVCFSVPEGSMRAGCEKGTLTGPNHALCCRDCAGCQGSATRDAHSRGRARRCAASATAAPPPPPAPARPPACSGSTAAPAEGPRSSNSQAHAPNPLAQSAADSFSSIR